MIDKIIGYDDWGMPIYSSDIYYMENYIGYEDIETGNIILY